MRACMSSCSRVYLTKTPSETSEHKERFAAFDLHDGRIGIVIARSLRKTKVPRATPWRDFFALGRAPPEMEVTGFFHERK